MTLESLPRDATHGSTRSLAKQCGLSRSTVNRIWRAFALQPHRTGTFKLSKDPLLIDKVRDIVGLYLKPPDRALVLCVDERSQIRALDRSQPLLPMRPGQAERCSHDYKRHGTTLLFAALDVRTGKVIGACHRRHRSVEFRKFLNTIEQAVPASLDVHLILDNYRHSQNARQPFLAGETPSLPGALHTHQRVRDQPGRTLVRRSHRETDPPWVFIAASTAIKSYLALTNASPRPFIWTKTADEILNSVARFCQRTSERGHWHICS